MKLTIRNPTLRIALLVGFGLTIVLLTIRHYYEAATFNRVQSGSQSIIQTIAVLNNTIELTLELSHPPDDQLTDPTTQAIYKSNRSARNTAAIRPLLDSLVSLTRHRPELNPLARRLQTEAESVLQTDIRRSVTSGKQIQQLVRSLRTFRLALADSLLDSQEQINERIATMRTLDNIIDGLVLLLAAALLFIFYRYTLRRERLTKQMLNRQKELTQYLEAIPEGVIVLNTDRQVVYVNQTAQEFLDITLTGKPMTLGDWAHRFSLSYADTKLPFQPEDIPLGRALRGEAVSVDNMLLETKNGFRFVASHARPIYSRESEIVGAISIFRDITEARHKEEELQRARTIAEQSLQEREIFLANISHDIRTPLNAILGFTEILRQKRSAPDEQEYLNGIKLSGNNLLALINELLDISRIESGQLVLDPVPTQLDEIIQTVKASLSAQAGDKGLRSEVVSDAAMPSLILTDPVRLTQVLLNFCSNAVKFTKEGYVRLRVRTESAHQPEQIDLVFDIEDSGAGIAEADHIHLFNRFSRVMSDNLFRSAGTGLGLNIAQSLVSLMNGKIDVQSRLGQGTTFTIRIPVTIPDAVEKPEPVPQPATHPDRSTIDVLIVEDNELNQKVLQGFLTRYQLKPAIANNGLEAVTMLEEQVFDLILMDIQMPQMDGYTAAQTIRQRLALDTPIIAMTAYTMPGERERCLAAGMNEYMAKPIRIEQIDEILMRFAPGLALTTSSAMNSSAETGEKELINQAYLDEVTGGDSELLAELLSLFSRDLPQYRQALFEAIEARDRHTFNQSAHKFRSSLNSLAMLSLSEQLKKMENEDQSFNLDFGAQLAGLFQDINRGLTRLENQLEQDMSS
ncbi:response regulator [Spirosoma taeanense]|uniref:histidine kinase n=1 Tax=Spirosoma taeanense TaxID=2735870 RepID=A0A6M5YB41_9BACT|nr:ATP-binding protein [Spirosoma taeanense]QJW91205.1 response regulator [Spirosoma taeanense]